MQNNRKHIDDFLRDKMQDLQFEVNESHWADAERRLDEDEDKKKPFWLFFVAIVVLVGAGLTALTQFQGNKNTSSLAVNNIAVRNNSAPNTSTNQTNNNTATPLESTTPNETTHQNTIRQNLINKQNITNTQTSQSTMPATNAQGFTKKNTANVAKQSVDNNVKSKNTNHTNAPAAPNNNKTLVNTLKTKNTIADNQSQQTDVVAKPNKTTKSKTKKMIADADATAVVKIKAIQEKANAFANNETNDPTAAPVMNALAPNATTNGQNSVPEKTKNLRVYKSPGEYAKLNPRYVASLQNYVFTETIIPLDQIKSDSIRNEASKQNTAESKAVAKKKAYRDSKIFIQAPSSFYILAGIGGARGYIGNSTASPAWGLSPSLGLGYEQTFSDRMSVYLSVYMSYISHLNIKETATSVTYSFDRDSTLLSVTRKNLLQLHIPIQLSYKLTPKFSVMVGVGFNLGLNSVSIYEDSKQRTSNKQFGYMGGLRFLDVNANLGFDYAISPRISLGVFYQQGFLDMTKNNYFNNQQSDINARGGIQLRYKFRQ